MKKSLALTAHTIPGKNWCGARSAIISNGIFLVLVSTEKGKPTLASGTALPMLSRIGTVQTEKGKTMRLIDAGKLRAEYLGMPNCYNGFSDSYDKAMIVDMVDEQPTIDAVPVVRCKDCTEFSDDDEEDGWGFCNNTGVGMERDGFCSCGERKDDG